MLEVEIIFFDAGGTLLYPDPPLGEVYARIGARHGLAAFPADLEEAFRRAFSRKRARAIPQDREWWRGVVIETFAAFGEPARPDALFDELYRHFARPEAWALFPGARAVPRELRRRGYRTGLLSNWDDRLPGLLSGLRLLPGLDPLVISSEVGAEKPDPRIFDAALVRAGVPPGRALLVGDDPAADVEGARARGLHAVLFDPRGRGPADGARIRALADLLALLPGREG